MHVLSSRSEKPFRFPGLFGREACCDLELHELADGRWVAIATERPDNPGASVTNAAEMAATWAAFRFEVPPERLVWIEHYAEARQRGHTWDRVTFALEPAWGGPGGDKWPPVQWHFAHPDWRPMGEDDWHELGIRPEGA